MKRILLALVLICFGLVSVQAQYIAPYSGAVPRTNNSKMADIVSVFDFIPVSLQAAIKAGTSTTDVSSYLAAMQSAVPAGVKFLFPAGQYNIGAGATALTGRTVDITGATFTGGGSITGYTTLTLVTDPGAVTGAIKSNGAGTFTQADFPSVTGTAAPAQIGSSAASHAVPVDVAGTTTWKVVPDCVDTGGNHLNFTQSTDAFSCGTSGSGLGLHALYASNYGVVCDGSTNNTTAWEIAIAAFPSSGGTLYVPPGICIGTLVVNKNVQVRGAGYGQLSSGTPTGACGTEIRSTGAADNVVTLSSLTAGLSDVCVTSSVAPSSRTGTGVYLNGVGQGVVERVMVYGHKYGFQITGGGGPKIKDSFSVGNLSHGFYQTGANNENIYTLNQSNGNGGDGFRLEGTGLGTRLNNITAYTNTGYAIDIAGTLTGIWIDTPEVGGSSGGSEIFMTNTSGIQIMNCFCEGSGIIVNVSTGTALVSIVGGFIQGGVTGVQNVGTAVTVSGIVFKSFSTAAIRHGNGAAVSAYTGNSTNAVAGNGLMIDAGSGTFTATGNSLNGATTPLAGAANIAAGSSVCGNSPIATTTQGAGGCY